MRPQHLLAGLLAAVPIAALAAPPPTSSAWQVNLPLLYGSRTYAPVTIPGWLDTSAMQTNPDGTQFPTVRSAGPDYPLPVTIAGGGTSSSNQGTPNAGGAQAWPVVASQSGTWTLTLANGSHLALDAGGNVIGAVTQSGAWSVAVSNFPATQAVSATALPLPAGAATSANQPPLTTPGTPGTQSTTVTAVPGTVTYAAPASSAITTGGTAQAAASAGSITHGCDLQNPTAATEPLYYNLAGAATTAAAGTTFALTPGQAYHCPFPTTQALSVNAATTGHAFSLVVY